MEDRYKNTAFKILEQHYKNALELKPSNIEEHLPTLKKYAEECDYITEMGVDRVVSTYAFMMGKPKKMISYDINPTESFGISREYLKELGLRNGIDYTFIEADTTKIEIEETDLLFIDTEHNYLQLKTELLLHGNKARKYLIFHDTVTFAYTDSNAYGHYTNLKQIDDTDLEKYGLIPAIDEFINKNPHWVMHEHYPNNNGLIILKNYK
jgi:hypothetical protein